VIIPDDEEQEFEKFLAEPAHNDKGNGESLSGFLATKAESAEIEAFKEELDPDIHDSEQTKDKFGSIAMFDELKHVMMQSTDVLIYIHGFNVSWHDAVGAALSLQEMINRAAVSQAGKRVLVVLFSWPSDGLAMPFVSYKSDRTEAEGSGYAIGRGFLKLRNYLSSFQDRPNAGPVDTTLSCNQKLHLLCHSMGNYVLQNALQRLREMNTGIGLPRIFDQLFMCSPDVDEDVFETGEHMADIHRLCCCVSVYYNRGDVAMYISDYSKGNPERLGTNGAARPSLIHNKIHQIDCSNLVTGIVEHSYYLWGPVNTDIRKSIDNIPYGDTSRDRKLKGVLQNVWEMN
jgi:esterase/lipase superfamily enzyme